VKRSHSRDEKAIALVMAVAIMAVLAVVGFGFATSMKLENRATQALRNLSQARMGAQAALQLLIGALAHDSASEPSGTAGPVADHIDEDLYSTGASRTLTQWGNLQVRADQLNFRDESSKMNLNAFGNIAKWDFADLRFDSSGLPGGLTEADQLYHGANHRFSSFEISFEEFFYQHRATLWLGVSDINARIRAANIARAICLYRHGGKKDGGDADSDPDYEGDGHPGVAGTDDDKDNDYGTNGVDDDRDTQTDGGDPGEAECGLQSDELDNDGDGTVDEAEEGIDEPDEFLVPDPDRDGAKTTTNGPCDDRRFDKIEELKDAIRHSYSLVWDDSGGAPHSLTVPAAVNYDNHAVPDQDAQDALDDEAERITNIIKSELTVYSFNLAIRAVCLDDPRFDGYDNDHDGFVDEGDTTGATTIADIKGQLDGGTNIHQANINERDITKAAQVAYIYWKLNRTTTFTQASGSVTTGPLVPNLGLQNAIDLVDYRDTDCVPTKIAAAAMGVGFPSKDIYGFEGLHVTEVGRYMSSGDAMTVAGGDGPWTGTGAAGITVTISGAPGDRTSVLQIGGLADGAYMIKCNVAMPGGIISFEDVPNTTSKDATAGGEFFFGPVNVSGGTGRLSVTASATNGTYTISNIHVLLPYIEIMNMSKRKHDMTQFSVQVGTNPTKYSIVDANITGPASWANGEALAKKYCGRHIKVGTGFDEAGGHGPYYGYFLIAYDAAALANNMGGGAVDFPICQMRDLFADGFDGTQKVRLWGGPTKSDLVAGGSIDFYTDSAAFPTGVETAFSATALAAGRTQAAGTQFYAVHEKGLPAFSIETVSDGDATPTTSPGRWNHNEHAAYTERFWPATVAAFSSGSDARDIVSIADRGYFLSAGELYELAIPKLFSSTVALVQGWTDNGWQPHPVYWTGFCVASRAPARVNVNTAPAEILAAVLVDLQGSEPDASALSGARPLISADDAASKDAIKNAYNGNGTDDDDANDGDDDGERTLWLRNWLNVFSLRSNVFSSTVSGQIKNEKGQVLATQGMVVVAGRGKGLNSDGSPKVVVLDMR